MLCLVLALDQPLRLSVGLANQNRFPASFCEVMRNRATAGEIGAESGGT